MRRKVPAGLALLLAVLAVGACGGGVTEDSDSSQVSSGAGDTTGVTKDTITFGMVTPLAGQAAQLGQDGRAGAQALIAKVNEEGGINGRQLKLLVQDDKYDPKQAVAGARYFASQAPVFGLWGNIGGATTLAALPVYEQANLPLLFPLAFTSKLYDYPSGYQLTTSFLDTYEMFSNYLAEQPGFTEDHKFGIMYQNDGTSVEYVDGFKQGATELAMAVPFERTANSYRAQLQRMQAAGITDVLMVGNVAAIAIALKEANATQFKPQWWGTLVGTSPDTFKLAGKLAEGMITVNPYVSPDSDEPGAAEFRDAMAKYQPNATQSNYALNSWVGGLIIIDALERAGEDLTRESFLEALNDTKELDMGGLMTPVTISADRRIASVCNILLEAKGGTFVPRGEPLCPSS